MTVVLLFCIAEEAKPFIHTILSLPETPLALVEQQECPSDESGLRSKLADNEEFTTEFAGASVEDCQKWILKHQDTAMFVEPNIIGIADARTAKDGTILMTWYREMEGENCPPYGVLPPEADSWWDFRVRPEQAPNVLADLNFVAPDVTFPWYFARKDEFTDEDGVFDAVKAARTLKKQ
ncbi:hypothetical protein BDV95DRAFT_669637 [Massariosphaeria phaeospora]|uniref:Uncharacterized protein n=1 Tax=Massariosphaeria phaeospora TaxID=100035 RepID=A0A7C8I7K3_9PLEO|nr:hypothetical protein BDV95DRAFT_669637 [Massariosphaeria phaeospora]